MSVQVLKSQKHLWSYHLFRTTNACVKYNETWSFSQRPLLPSVYVTSFTWSFSQRPLLPSVYIISFTWSNLPDLPSLFLHTVKWSKAEKELRYPHCSCTHSTSTLQPSPVALWGRSMALSHPSHFRPPKLLDKENQWSLCESKNGFQSCFNSFLVPVSVPFQFLSGSSSIPVPIPFWFQFHSSSNSMLIFRL